MSVSAYALEGIEDGFILGISKWCIGDRQETNAKDKECKDNFRDR